jgi:hypothetical protein
MSQNGPGFLTPTQRKYLEADEEWRKQKRKENPNIRRRIRQAMDGAEEDWARVLASDARLLDGLDMTQERIVNETYTRTPEKVETGLKSVLAQKSKYAGDNPVGLDLDGESPEEVLDSLEEEKSKIRDLIGRSVVEALTDSGDDVEGLSDEQSRRFIEIVFPDKEKVQEIIVEEFSER